MFAQVTVTTPVAGVQVHVIAPVCVLDDFCSDLEGFSSNAPVKLRVFQNAQLLSYTPVVCSIILKDVTDVGFGINCFLFQINGV